jgi:hypothetical protein
MVISQVKAEKAALELGLGKELSDWQIGKLSFQLFMERITAKRKRGSLTIQQQSASELEAFVNSKI